MTDFPPDDPAPFRDLAPLACSWLTRNYLIDPDRFIAAGAKEQRG